MSLDKSKLESNLSSSTKQLAGWVALGLGVLTSMGALSWLSVSLIFGPTSQMLTFGFIQLGIGIFLIAVKWITPSSQHVFWIVVAIVLLMINAAIGFWLVLGSLLPPRDSSAERNVRMLRNQDLPLIVSCQRKSAKSCRIVMICFCKLNPPTLRRCGLARTPISHYNILLESPPMRSPESTHAYT